MKSITLEERNRRYDNNPIISYNGESRTLKEWADKLGIKHSKMYNRIRYGWSIEDVFRK